jgi:hypothetical protein
MRLALLFSLAVITRFAGAQALPAATVSGVVRDSITRAPLAGAVVQLVSAQPAAGARSAVSDSLGRFAISDVPAGRHTIGFFHPMLDSLGLDASQHEVNVEANKALRVDLGTPSPERIRAAICTRTGAAISTLIIGFVREPNGAHVAGATVTARWSEISFSRGNSAHRSQQLVATSAGNGWFAICNAPSSGMLSMEATRGRDSTDAIELQMPPDGFLRRDLHVGLARVTDSVGGAARIRQGEGRLSGTVVALVDGRPLDGAVVGIVDGPQTRANQRGEWSLVNAPSGTRTLEIRALGYYPTRRAVDVVEGAPPIRIALPTLKAVLDTVRVTAARLADRYKSGFEDRRRIGAGHYVTAADIARRRAVNMAQVLRAISGLRLDATLIRTGAVYDSTGALVPQYTTSNSKILMRSPIEDWCYPTIYVDGHIMPDLDADDLNNWIRPEAVLGIEVYPGISAPPEFQPGMSGCGSILIWRR